MTEKNFSFKNEEQNEEKAMLKAEAKLDSVESSTCGEDSFISKENINSGEDSTTANVVLQDQAIYEQDKANNSRTITPTWKKEEVWVLHQQDTHPRTISQKVQLSLLTVKKIIEEFTKQEKADPEKFNADRDVLRNAFINKAWEIIKEADDLTLAKLKEGKASALQANIIAGVKIDKVLLLQGKANQITEQKHYLDKDMFTDLAKILTKRSYEHKQ